MRSMLLNLWCCALILTSWMLTESYSQHLAGKLFYSRPPYLRGIKPSTFGGEPQVEKPVKPTEEDYVKTVIVRDKSVLNITEPHSRELKSDEKIIGGREARKGEFPWIVSLSWVGGTHFCGGSLLTLKHVLTACHCTCRYKDDVDEDLINVKEFIMSAGSRFTYRAHKSRSSLQKRSPLTFKVHPDCRSKRKGGYLFDYAVVFPKTPFKTSRTLEVMKVISLDQGANWKYLTELVKNRRWCKAVGWGSTGIYEGAYVNISDALRVVGVQLIRFAECHHLLSNFSNFYDSIDVKSRYQVCAMNDRKSDACKGDSGGGFVCGTYVFGLLSWGPSCGEKNTPSMYASIDGGWDFIVKSIVSLTSRILPTSFQRLLAVKFVVFIINHIRNI